MLGEPWTFLAMFAYSLSVSAHCAGMCGPLLANSLVQKTQASAGRRWLALVQYQLGRGIAYVSAGAVCGAVGHFASSLTEWLSASQLVFSVGMGCLLVAAGIYQLVVPTKTGSGGWFYSGVMRLLRKVMGTSSEVTRSFLLGFFTVLLPCMTLTPALLAAAATHRVQDGALLMLAFYAGTVPAMMAVGAFALVRVPRWIPFRFVSALFLIVAGTLTIVRATPLHHYLH